MNRYGFSVYAGNDFNRVIRVVIRELKKQGFGIVADINLQQIFKEKLAVDEPRYRIFGACNPWVANQVIHADPDIGLLLPCNVVVREAKDGEVTVSFAAPEVLLGLVYRTDVIKLGAEMRQRLEKVRDAVAMETSTAA